MLCCGGSQIWSRGGGGILGSALFWWVGLFHVGYIICGNDEG
jgi:hypothetical protein